MMELYLHDFSEFDGEDLNEHGLFESTCLDYYWHEKSHFAYVCRINGKYAGFALVNDDVIDRNNKYWLAQFFILRKYRKHGAGKYLARHVFSELRGCWEIGQDARNEPALHFWRATLRSLDTPIQEVQLNNDDWQGIVFAFCNADAA